MYITTCAAFHKVELLQGHSSRQTDDFDVTSFQIHWNICVPIIISTLKGLTKLL